MKAHREFLCGWMTKMSGCSLSYNPDPALATKTQKAVVFSFGSKASVVR